MAQKPNRQTNASNSGPPSLPAPIQHQPNVGSQQQQQQHQPSGTSPTASWSSNTNFHEHLKKASSFHVRQKIELLEAVVGWETANQYTVRDQSGNNVFYVGEESGCCVRQCCSSYRPFTLNAKDSTGRNTLIFDRSLDCSCCCGLFCPDSLTVSTPSGQLLGTVKETFNILFPSFDLVDAHGNTRLRVEGPFCTVSCCGPVVFRVMDLSGFPVGTIAKEWGGLAKELFTDADYFTMSFPADLDTAMKATCLGALFLIDFEYFENK